MKNSRRLASVKHVGAKLFLVITLVGAACAIAAALSPAKHIPSDTRRFAWSSVYGSLLLDDRKQVVIVSDNEEAGKLLRDELSQSGYRAIIAGDIKKKPTTADTVTVHIEGTRSDSNLAGHEEGYSIDIAPEGVRLQAASHQGMYRGIASLLCLARESSFTIEGRKTVYLPYVSMVDFPQFVFRAVHLPVSDRREMPIYRHVIREAFFHRFNAIILEFNLNLEYMSHPELADPITTLSKTEMKSLIDMAKRYHMEVIPGINSFAHQNKRLFEKYPDFLWNIKGQNPDNLVFDPGKTDVHKLYLNLYREVIDLFKPRYFHIGHDEVMVLQNLPSEKSARVFADNVRVFHGFLARHGIRTIMWGDMLLKGDYIGVQDGVHGGLAHTAAAVDLLPRDIILMDWHYSRINQGFKSSSYFIDKGYTVIGTTFDDPLTTERFARFLTERKSGAMGMCATLWYRVPWRHLTAISDILRESEKLFWGDRRIANRT